MRRREFVAVGLSASFAEAQNAQSRTAKYLQSIKAVDGKIHSVIELNPDAMAIAAALDKEPRKRGPLHGIPILVKDNIDTGDKMRTSAGSLALAEHRAAQDAPLAARLRKAGAVILGKTNLSEWANFRSSHSSSGWSGRGGQTRNPYVLDRNPSGSSSGSGAAVAAELCFAAVGTETDGSIVSPSSINGVVGIKPTLGLISQSGIIPIARSQDTAGPMARTVADAALLLGAMADNESDYTKYLDKNGLQGKRVGIVRKAFPFHEPIKKLMETSIQVMKQLGATVVDDVELPNYGKYDDAENEVLLFEFKAGLNAYLSKVKTGVKSLSELIAFNEKNRDKELIYFNQDTLEKANGKGPLTSSDYRAALEMTKKMSQSDGIDSALMKNKLDALIAPTDGLAWPTDHVNGDHFTASFSTPAAVAGYPHITVPMGYVSELPIGISFVGKAFSEPVLIAMAFAYEQATKARKPPRFLPTLG